MREISLSNRLLTCLVVGNYMTKPDLGGYFKQDSRNAVFSRLRQNPDRLTRLPLGRLSPLLVRLRLIPAGTPQKLYNHTQGRTSSRFSGSLRAFFP